MTDQMAEIATERAAAQAQVAEAERLMKEGARDAAAFRKAKRQHEAAVEALERLDWAEKAEQERQQQAQLQAKVDAMREAQLAAQAAHDQAKAAAVEVAQLVEAVIGHVKALQAAQLAVERGVRYEQFGVRDGYLDKQTLKAQVAVDAELAVRLARAGRELGMLVGMPAPTVEAKAAQGRL